MARSVFIALDELPRRSEARDDELVGLVRSGDRSQFAILIRRYNQRLYRIARSITGNESEAEDVTQQAFLSAFQNLGQFTGKAPFSSWLTRIAVNEALSRTRKQKRFVALGPDDARSERSEQSTAVDSPEDSAMRREAAGILEAALENVAEHHRTVFVLRDVEEMSTAETAEALDISVEAVRTRLHRARAAMREVLLGRFGLAATDVFPFAGERCDRIVARVFATISTA